MDTSCEKSAEYIKGILIDYYLEKLSGKDFFIGNEVVYGSKRKVSDLVVYAEGVLIGIEIKSSADNLQRLGEQIEESGRVFDYTIICTTANHINQILQLSLGSVGVFLVDSGRIKILRKPKKTKSIEKKEMLYTVSSAFLKRYLPREKRNLDSDQIRTYLISKSQSTIKFILRDYLRKRISPKFFAFLKCKGKYTHVDDISILSSPLMLHKG